MWETLKVDCLGRKLGSRLEHWKAGLKVQTQENCSVSWKASSWVDCLDCHSARMLATLTASLLAYKRDCRSENWKESNLDRRRGNLMDYLLECRWEPWGYPTGCC